MNLRNFDTEKKKQIESQVQTFKEAVVPKTLNGKTLENEHLVFLWKVRDKYIYDSLSSIAKLELLLKKLFLKTTKQMRFKEFIENENPCQESKS